MLWILRPHAQVWLVPWLSLRGFKNWGSSLMFGTDGRSLVFSQWASPLSFTVSCGALSSQSQRCCPQGCLPWWFFLQTTGSITGASSLFCKVWLWGEAFADCLEPFPMDLGFAHNRNSPSSPEFLETQIPRFLPSLLKASLFSPLEPLWPFPIIGQFPSTSPLN